MKDSVSIAMFSPYNEKIAAFEAYSGAQTENCVSAINCHPITSVCTFSPENVLNTVPNGGVQIIGELVEDSSSEKLKMDPFAVQCRIPLPSLISPAYFDTANFIRRRNERERVRVRNVNEGFERLRSHLPLSRSQQEKRLSKVETLRLAIAYIKHLQQMLNQ